MRLHHLEITAFGPFADTVAVDFDALSASGLFLLTGATGAGKTSVLDAVCFALYGDVPGDRATARRLRSDQAAAGRRAAGRPRVHPGRAPVPHHPVPRLAATQEARHRHHPAAGLGHRHRARRRRLGAAHLAGWTRPATSSPSLVGMTPDPVHPGRDAAPGPLPDLPAGPLRGAPPAAPAAVPHRPLRAGRALAARPPPRPRRDLARPPPRGRRRSSAGSARPPPGPLPDDWDAHDLAPAADDRRDRRLGGRASPATPRRSPATRSRP